MLVAEHIDSQSPSLVRADASVLDTLNSKSAKEAEAATAMAMAMLTLQSDDQAQHPTPNFEAILHCQHISGSSHSGWSPPRVHN